MNVASATPIYQSQGILTLLSRAWNLLRLNLKQSLLIMAVPTLLNTGMYILLALMSDKTVLTGSSAAELGFRLLILGVVALLAVPAMLLWAVSFCVLCRFYYLALIQDQPPRLRDCFRFLGKNWLSLTGMILLLGLLVLGLIVINIVILFLGIMLVGFIMSTLAVSAASQMGVLPKVMMAAFALVIGFAAMLILICLITIEGFLFAFPVLSLLTASDSPKRTFWQHISQSYQLILRQFPRAIGFNLALLIFTWSLMGVLMAPASLWTIIELTRTGMGMQHGLPTYIQTVWNIWSSMANILIMPFHLCALTLFWYDCQVRSQGLDLRLWIEKRIRQQKPTRPAGLELP